MRASNDHSARGAGRDAGAARHRDVAACVYTGCATRIATTNRQHTASTTIGAATDQAAVPALDCQAATSARRTGPAEATRAVAAATDDLGDDAGLDALVRLALKKAAK